MEAPRYFVLLVLAFTLLLLSGCSAVSIDDEDSVRPPRPFFTNGRAQPNGNAIPPEF